MFIKPRSSRRGNLPGKREGYYLVIKNRSTFTKRTNLTDILHNIKAIKIFFRVLTAIVFALPAFIFSEVIPHLPPFHPTLIRVVVTVWFALLGYGLFPDLAKIITLYTISVINAFVTKIGTEVATQMANKLPLPPPLTPSFTASSNVSMSVSKPLILDTSAIIDGRILDIAKTHFLSGTILLPAFVLTELQQVADSSDYIKRSRGRRGFDIIEELKKIKGLHIEVWDNDVSAKAVDDKLIKLARNLNGKIITTDYNLNKVASVSNVPVLNVNDLANAVKAVAIPGERLKVKIVHLGKDPKQGIGYLPDGTMIVVEDGAEQTGKEVETEVLRVLQGSAGRMIFTKIVARV